MQKRFDLVLKTQILYPQILFVGTKHKHSWSTPNKNWFVPQNSVYKHKW